MDDILIEDSKDISNALQGSISKDFNHNLQIEDKNTLNTSQNYDGEPLNEFEKIITANLNYINSNNGVLRHIKANDIKNKEIENIKHLVEWIKSEHIWVDKYLTSNVTQCTDERAESNTKLADAVSRFEMKVTNDETKIGKVMEYFRLKFKSEFEQKFNEFDSRISGVLIKIAEAMNKFNSSLLLVSNQVLIVENNYNAFVGDFNKKLADLKIYIKSETDNKNTEFDKNINELKLRLETLDKEMCQMRSSVGQEFSANKEFADSISEELKLCNLELIESRTDCQQNDIDRKIEINCFDEKIENVKFLSENISKDLNNMRDSIELKQNCILDKANDALALAERNEKELVKFKTVNLRLDSLKEGNIKLNGSINNLCSVQKDNNDVLTVLSENDKKVKQDLNDLNSQQKKMECNIKYVSEKQKVVEKNLSQIDALYQSCETSIKELNKWMSEKNVWFENSDKKYNELKRDNEKHAKDNSTLIDMLMNQNKKLEDTSKFIKDALDKETNNLKNKISKVERDVKGQSSNFLQLATNVKDNIKDNIRVAYEQKDDLIKEQHSLQCQKMRVNSVVFYPYFIVWLLLLVLPLVN